MTSPAVLAAGLRAHAQGLCCLEAAAELLIAQSWLHRDDFTSQFITVYPGVASGEPAHVARYAFQLAQAFSNFYHDYPVLHESDPERKTFLLWLTSYFRAQLERTLAVLGIPVPRYM